MRAVETGANVQNQPAGPLCDLILAREKKICCSLVHPDKAENLYLLDKNISLFRLYYTSLLSL